MKLMTPARAWYCLRWPVALAVLLTAACSSSSPASSSAEAPGSPAASPSAAPSSSSTAPAPAPASPSATPTPTDSGTGLIGGPAVSVPGNVTISVGKPARHSVSSSVANGAGTTRTGNQIAVFPVAMTSTGKKPLDVTLTAVNAYAGGEQLDLIDYSAIPADNHFSGTLLPGKTKKATFAFTIRKSDTDLQVEVYVGEQGASHAIFTGSGNGTT